MSVETLGPVLFWLFSPPYLVFAVLDVLRERSRLQGTKFPWYQTCVHAVILLCSSTLLFSRSSRMFSLLPVLGFLVLATWVAAIYALRRAWKAHREKGYGK